MGEVGALGGGQGSGEGGGDVKDCVIQGLEDFPHMRQSYKNAGSYRSPEADRNQYFPVFFLFEGGMRRGERGGEASYQPRTRGGCGGETSRSQRQSGCG